MRRQPRHVRRRRCRGRAAARTRTSSPTIRDRTTGRHPSRPALHHARRCLAGGRDGPRRPHMGQRPGRPGRDADRHVPTRRRSQRTPARAHCRRPRARAWRRGTRRSSRCSPTRSSRTIPVRSSCSTVSSICCSSRCCVRGSRATTRRRPGTARRATPSSAHGAATPPQQPRAPLDRRRARPRDGCLSCRVRAPVQRTRRRTPDDVPHRLAAGARRRPAARTRRHRRRGRSARSATAARSR